VAGEAHHRHWGLYCPPRRSLYVAAFLGVWVWLTVGLIGFRLRPKVRYLFVSFIALYVTALAVLWSLAPVFWGARHCTE
jgi:hypothetical protein